MIEHKIIVMLDDYGSRFNRNDYSVYEVCPRTDGMRFLARFYDKCYALEWAEKIAKEFGGLKVEEKNEGTKTE